MKKENLIKMFSEGLNIEEIPVISNLEELKGCVNNSDLEDSVKAKLRNNINFLIKDTLKHARIFSGLIKDVLK